MSDRKRDVLWTGAEAAEPVWPAPSPVQPRPARQPMRPFSIVISATIGIVILSEVVRAQRSTTESKDPYPKKIVIPSTIRIVITSRSGAEARDLQLLETIVILSAEREPSAVEGSLHPPVQPAAASIPKDATPASPMESMMTQWVQRVNHLYNRKP